MIACIYLMGPSMYFSFFQWHFFVFSVSNRGVFTGGGGLAAADLDSFISYFNSEESAAILGLPSSLELAVLAARRVLV